MSNTQETVQDYFDSDEEEVYTPFASDNEEEEKKKEFSTSGVIIEDVNATLSQEDFDTQQIEEEKIEPVIIEEEPLIAEEEPLQIIIEPVPLAPVIRPRRLPRTPAPSFLELSEPKIGKNNNRTVTKQGHSIYQNSKLYQENPCPPKEIFSKFEKLGAKKLEDSQYRVFYRAKDCGFNLGWLEEKMKSMGLKPNDELYWIRYNGHISQGRYTDPWPDIGTVHHFVSGEQKLIVENSNQYSRKRNTGFVILRDTR
jgi:hypothetical protein